MPLGNAGGIGAPDRKGIGAEQHRRLEAPGLREEWPVLQVGQPQTKVRHGQNSEGWSEAQEPGGDASVSATGAFSGW